MAFLQNPEKNPAFFELPKNEYVKNVDDLLVAEIRSEENEISQLDQVAAARLEVEKSYDLPAAKIYEQIDESMFEEMLELGQQIHNARRYHLENNPYKYPVKGQAFSGRMINRLRNSFYEPNSEDDLIEKEREIGARIFQIPGFTFFMTESKHWWSHFERQDNKKASEVTTHYEVMLMATKANVLKCSSEIHERNEFISGEELKRLNEAIRMYHKLVLEELYGLDANTANIDNYLE